MENSGTTNCEYCRELIKLDDVIKHDDLDICESCHEGALVLVA